MKGSVEEGSLELLDIDTDEVLPCVHFGPAYYGTDKTQAAILYNKGPEPVAFVAVLDEDAVGQEVVCLMIPAGSCHTNKVPEKVTMNTFVD